VNLTDVCIRRPVMAWAMLLSVVLMGGWALFRIGISQLPDVDLPFLVVQVTWQGASPEAVEHDVIDPLEDALSQVEGVTAMTSTARLGGATVQLELDVNRKVDVALQDVQAKVSQA
jgi:multidrug efflux pump subunit AcrB